MKPVRKDQDSADGKGLLAHGPTGGGKTRSVWWLCRRLMAEGIRIVSFRQGDFADRMHQAVARGDFASWKARLMTDPAVVIIDDFGNEQTTPFFVTHARQIIARRAENMHPTIITTQYTGEAIAQTVGQQGTQGDILASSLVRRFREEGLFDRVAFGIEKEKA